jgi:hypothetical protein
MNPKHWILSGLILFAFGCSQAPVQSDEAGESMPISRDVASEAALGGDQTAQEAAPRAESPAADPSSIAASVRTAHVVEGHRTKSCGNTLAYVKSMLRAGGRDVSFHTGNAGVSGPVWLNHHYSQLSPNEKTKDYDICVYEGGARGVGTIAIKLDNVWKDGCAGFTGVPSHPKYILKGCYRPPAKS